MALGGLYVEHHFRIHVTRLNGLQSQLRFIPTFEGTQFDDYPYSCEYPKAGRLQ